PCPYTTLFRSISDDRGVELDDLYWVCASNLKLVAEARPGSCNIWEHEGLSAADVRPRVRECPMDEVKCASYQCMSGCRREREAKPDIDERLCERVIELEAQVQELRQLLTAAQRHVALAVEREDDAEVACEELEAQVRELRHLLAVETDRADRAIRREDDAEAACEELSNELGRLE